MYMYVYIYIYIYIYIHIGVYIYVYICAAAEMLKTTTGGVRGSDAGECLGACLRGGPLV